MKVVAYRIPVVTEHTEAATIWLVAAIVIIPKQYVRSPPTYTVFVPKVNNPVTYGIDLL